MGKPRSVIRDPGEASKTAVRSTGDVNSEYPRRSELDVVVMGHCMARLDTEDTRAFGYPRQVVSGIV